MQCRNSTGYPRDKGQSGLKLRQLLAPCRRGSVDDIHRLNFDSELYLNGLLVLRAGVYAF